jgi:hypothetical protein
LESDEQSCARADDALQKAKRPVCDYDAIEGIDRGMRFFAASHSESNASSLPDPLNRQLVR